MATDATGTPTTNYNIPKYNPTVDAPSGLGFNAVMDFIDSLLKTTFASAGAIPWANVSKTGSTLADLVTRSAGDLSSGTLLDARLSANVPLKNAANAFTGTPQTVVALVASGAVTIGGGAPVTQVLKGTSVGGSAAPGVTNFPVTVTGAAAGDLVFVSLATPAVPGNMVLKAQVTAANTVTVIVENTDAVSRGTGTITALVVKA